MLEGSVVLDRPVKEVFSYVADMENYPAWFRGIAEMKPVDDSPIGIGKRYAEIAHLPGGKTQAIDVEIVAYESQRSFAIHASLAPALPRFDYTFEPQGKERTRFTWRCSMRGRGLKASIMRRVMPLILKPRLRQSLINLERIFGSARDRSMRAAVTRRFGPASDVTAVEEFHPRPTVQSGEVLVRQRMSSINHIDVARGQGYGRTLFALRGIKGFPMVLGNDVYGQVAALAPDVRDFTIGDVVFGAKPPSVAGSFAEYVAVPAKYLEAAPLAADEQLAGCPYVFLTAFAALTRYGGLNERSAKGARVFVQGGCGAVGSMAVQIARNWGAHVAVSCAPGDVDLARAQGAHDVFDFASGDYAKELGDFDIALCCADPSEEARMLSILKPGGVFVTVIHPTLALADEFGAVTGVLKARRLRAEKNKAAAREGKRVEWALFESSSEGLQQLAQWLGAGRIAVPVARHVPLSDIVSAHKAQMNGARGKLIIDISAPSGTARAPSSADSESIGT
jgi:NADPH:quinone reductase-like Zn-dependent oxidoreductase